MTISAMVIPILLCNYQHIGELLWGYFIHCEPVELFDPNQSAYLCPAAKLFISKMQNFIIYY